MNITERNIVEPYITLKYRFLSRKSLTLCPSNWVLPKQLNECRSHLSLVVLFLDWVSASHKVNSFVLPTPTLAPLFETFRFSMLCKQADISTVGVYIFEYWFSKIESRMPIKFRLLFGKTNERYFSNHMIFQALLPISNRN